jgi:hypothetical protein
MPVNVCLGANAEEFEIGVNPTNGSTNNVFASPNQKENGSNVPIRITGVEEYKRIFIDNTDNLYLIYGLEDFFKNGGKYCYAYRSTRTYENNTRDSIAWNLGACSSQVVQNYDGQTNLNSLGVNTIPPFCGQGILIWGARTVSTGTQWKYVKVRRLFIFIEESIEQGTKWLVFEPNNEKVWSRHVSTITDFLSKAWRDGMLTGNTSEEAFFVKCDRSTMTQNDIDNGRLIVVVGFAPLKPAEFIVIKIQQAKSGAKVEEI